MSIKSLFYLIPLKWYGSIKSSCSALRLYFPKYIMCRYTVGLLENQLKDSYEHIIFHFIFSVIEN